MSRTSDRPQRKHASRPTRRDFLQVGGLGLSGITLSQLLASQAIAKENGSAFIRDKSVILLYLSGGASHIETFDPKMDAPDGTRSVTGAVKTRLPGVTFGGTFPRLAAHADKLAIVRSFSHKVGGHEEAHVHVLSGGTDSVGKQQLGFSMGSCYARLRGTNHPDSGMPTYSLLTEKEVDGQYRKEIKRATKGSWPGSLGMAYAPFGHEVGWSADSFSGKTTENKSPLSASIKLNVPAEVLENRLALLRSMDRLKQQYSSTPSMAAVDKFTSQAMSLILGTGAEAFNYRKEDPRLVERYDTSHIRIGHKAFRPSTLGKQMLVARRLCEAGSGFVTVHSAGWDMHADGNNPGMAQGMEMLGRTLDQAVSVFLEDVEQRGLSDKILLVITGDFGRTPKVNKKGGRDHWAKLGTLAFAGGGLRMGQVIGQSARKADVPGTRPISPPEMMSTIMNTLFDVGEMRLQQGLPPDLQRLVENGRPIAPLFS
ncbi:MAG: DUF1501 domain-containing protein [Planctomycetaceae bacterium]|nr:DUF1501 domain-containing protein [Planctomycetaceae bacterium]